MQRTGRWQVQPLDTNSGLDGRSSVLVEAPRAASRCAKCRSISAAWWRASIFATVTSPQLRPALETALPQQSSPCDPWQTFNDLLPIKAARRTRRQPRPRPGSSSDRHPP